MEFFFCSFMVEISFINIHPHMKRLVVAQNRYRLVINSGTNRENRSKRRADYAHCLIIEYTANVDIIGRKGEDGETTMTKKVHKHGFSPRRVHPFNLSQQVHGLSEVFGRTFSFLFFNLTYSRWTSSLPSCLWSLRIFLSLPGSRLTIFFMTKYYQYFPVPIRV